MSRYLIPLLGLVLLLAVPAQADAPPDGWGVDCTNWIHYNTPVTTNDLIYDPVAGYYRDCETGLEVVWPPFQIDLWIELEIVIHFAWSNAQIHRVSVYDQIFLELPGSIEQNSGNYLIFAAVGNDPNENPYSMDHMNFIHDIFDRTGSDHGSNLPVTWWYANSGPENWIRMDPGPNGSYMFLIEEPCHHDFWVGIEINIANHAGDGFYKMHGDLCPLPVL